MKPFKLYDMKRMKYFFILIVGIFVAELGFAQPYIAGGNTRHRFAQMTLGVEGRFFPGIGTQSFRLGMGEDLVPFTLNGEQQTCLVIGGTHFWGHADFYISIPVLSLGDRSMLAGAETAFRFLPWRIKDKRLSPYMGVSWVPTSYQQGDGARLHHHSFPMQAGLVYTRKQYMFEMGAAYSTSNKQSYYIDPTRSIDLESHAWRFTVGIKWMFDSTVSAEKDWQSGKTKILTDTLAKLGRLDGWTVSIGPSSAMFLRPSSHNEEIYPFMHQPRRNAIFPEFGLGYYWHRPNIQANLSFRRIRSSEEGFGLRQRATRTAWTLEGYHFFGDYHGFVPFVGPAISVEQLHLSETGETYPAMDYRTTLVRPGITFGWDIRPNRLQSFYLRTNLRWIPNLHLNTLSGRRFTFDQLEFNFIQAVFLLNRW